MKLNLLRTAAAGLLITTVAPAQTNVWSTSGNIGIGTTTPQQELQLGNGMYLSVMSNNGYYVPQSWRRGNAGGMILAASTNPDGSGWSYGSRIVNHDYGDGLGLSFDVLQNGGWTNDALFISGRFGRTANIGIGTSNPGAKLEIAVPANGADGLQISRPGSPTWQLMNYGPFYIQEAGVGPRLVVAAGGNVGIGTANPQWKLDIEGPAFGIRSDNGNGTNLVIKNTRPGGREWAFVTWGDQSGGGSALTGKLSIYDNTSGGHRLVIGTDGNVGIGTTNPGHKLAVNGTIKAKEVIVETTGWSDYVFADDYALQPLAQVEAHIKAHKHLPGIPSASTVAAEGVNIGDMQAALLTKVEELTLHVIAQDKELSRLRETEKDLAALRAEVRQLRLNK